jgi:hypothetical protein
MKYAVVPFLFVALLGSMSASSVPLVNQPLGPQASRPAVRHLF